MNIYISSNFKKHFNTHIDFLDHNWINFFNKKNYYFKVIPNSINVTNKILNEKKKINLIILPGGNNLNGKDNLSKIRLNVEKKILSFGIKNNIPTLGICRGMQVINHYFGGKIKKIDKHMRTKHNVVFEKKFFKKSLIKVNSFHNFCIPKKFMAKEFLIFAKDKMQNVEMFKHNKKKIYGVMWHPERERNYKSLDFLIKKILN